MVSPEAPGHAPEAVHAVPGREELRWGACHRRCVSASRPGSDPKKFGGPFLENSPRSLRNTLSNPIQFEKQFPIRQSVSETPRRVFEKWTAELIGAARAGERAAVRQAPAASARTRPPRCCRAAAAGRPERDAEAASASVEFL